MTKTNNMTVRTVILFVFVMRRLKYYYTVNFILTDSVGRSSSGQGIF